MKQTLIALYVVPGQSKEFDNYQVNKFVFISDDYKTSKVSYNDTVAALKKNPDVFTNIRFEDGKVKTNGSLNRYSMLDAAYGRVINNPSAVVITRIEENGENTGFVVYMPNGTVEKMSVAKAVELTEKGYVANAKIRPLKNGGKSISSIYGNFELDQRFTKHFATVANGTAPKANTQDEAHTEKQEVVTFDIRFITDNLNKDHNYMGILLDTNDALKVNSIMKLADFANKRFADRYNEYAEYSEDVYGTVSVGASGVYTVINAGDLASMVKKLKEIDVKVVVGHVEGIEGKLLISVIRLDADGNDDEEIGNLEAEKSTYSVELQNLITSTEQLLKEMK